MKNKTTLILIIGITLLVLAGVISLFIGQYPLTIEGIFHIKIQRNIFLRLRLPRTLVALFGGFALGIAGYVFQTIFKNKLASPDVIGVSSGASVGAAIAILYLGSATVTVTISAFAGAIVALAFTALVSTLASKRDRVTIVLAGVAVQALAQTAIVFLKSQADPEKELASIEYWMWGGLNGSTLKSLYALIPITIVIVVLFMLLYRHITILSLDDTEARLLGAHTNVTRWAILSLATLLVASVISVTGLISFIALISSHIASLIIKRHSRTLMAFSGIVGGILMLVADCLTRLTTAELPISVYTSLIGAPVLIYLFILRGNRAGRNKLKVEKNG
jgi:iron complex transport system permease protein